MAEPIFNCEALDLILFDDFPVGDGYRYYAPAEFVADREQDEDGRSLRDLQSTFRSTEEAVRSFVEAGLVRIVSDTGEKLTPVEPPVPPPAINTPAIMDPLPDHKLDVLSLVPESLRADLAYRLAGRPVDNEGEE